MNPIFTERKRKLNVLKEQRKQALKRNTEPKGEKGCPGCQSECPEALLQESLYVCPSCGHHFAMGSDVRLDSVLDKGSAKELFALVRPQNPIDFPNYEQKLSALKATTGLTEACLCAVGTIGGKRCVCAVLDSRFLMGSMGTAVGEKIAKAAEYAKRYAVPLVIFSASGGARMQEGIFSLMQMAKTSGAIKSFSDSGGLFISVLTHPTTGGVTASFASLGDVILAEPGALIGFAGPRVIEQTIGEKLPEGFQRAEFLLEHGFVDAVVPRKELRNTLKNLISLHRSNTRYRRASQ